MPARRLGAADADSVPRVETVRLTRPDLDRRRALNRTHGRLVFASSVFALLFLVAIGRLSWVTVIAPRIPAPGDRPTTAFFTAPEPRDPELVAVPLAVPRGPRAMITDRNNEILAISLPTAALYANPRELVDPEDAARRLKAVLPRLDEAQVRARLSEPEKRFVYLARQITPREKLNINTLGIPGIYFENTERRRYPMGRAAAQVLGGVDVDGHGVAGIERFFDRRLAEDSTPIVLSLDVRIQAVVRDELIKAMESFRAIGGCGIVMDVRTGEIIAMVSLPDYDANHVGHATNEERFNRAVTGMYEPGSTFKLQTAAMALDYGTVQLWNEFNASQPIKIGRFTISDFEGKKRWLYFPEVLAYSSNIGAAHVAQTVGAERQRAWMRNMGMLNRISVEVPEAGLPIVQTAQAWKEIVTLTVAFGHGISVSPLHVARGTAAIANNGVRVRPTLLAMVPDMIPPDAERVMQQATSDTMRKLMRLVVTDGFGKTSEVPGYYPGGKTGTAEKTGRGGYQKKANVAAFTSVFPMHAPRYAVYMMLDEPKANASTYGYATAGWVIAPAAGRTIARIGPMLDMLPELTNAAKINASLAMPLQPTRPPNGVRSPPVAAVPPAAVKPGRTPPAVAARPAAPRPSPAMPAHTPRATPPTGAPATRDLRHEASQPPSTALLAAQYTAPSLVPAPNPNR
ncbi:MAG: penicillin-binding protein 2 [Acetobacteraceae bacterium]|nr:penicillin-binding protein 2 [Acetobacteraceae bacterium]